MKRARNLYNRIHTRENLAIAFNKAAKGKHDNREVVEFKNNFEESIGTMMIRLIEKKPDIGHYHFFTVRDPKVRSICAASFPERVLHHAIMNVCEPVLESYSIFDSYACRPGKGLHRALSRARGFSKKYPWFLKMDIRKYFDSIDHRIMMGLLSRRFKDKDVLNLFRQLLGTYHTKRGKGMPIGNLISQHLANFYLGPLDRRIKEARRIKGYLRYMDDFIIFAENKAQLKDELYDVIGFLGRVLELKLADKIQLNRCERGIPFLGFRVFPHKVLLSPASKRRFSKKFRKYEENFEKGVWTEDDLARHMGPLIEFTKAAHAKGFRKRIFEKYGVLF